MVCEYSKTPIIPLKTVVWPLKTTLLRKSEFRYENRKQGKIHRPPKGILGFHNQLKMPVVYRMADVFCLPSAGPGETWGLAINEALASGTPCIVSDRAGCAQDMGQLSQHVHVASPKNRHQWSQILSGIFKDAPRAPIEIPRPFSHDTMMAQINRRFNHE